MKKIVFCILFVILSLCSCNERTSTDSNESIETDALEQTSEEGFTKSPDEENISDDEEDSNDMVYNDDIDWGPLT